MNKNYGFSVIEYDNGVSIETLETGDGKSEFTDITYDDGTVAIGMSYGVGSGIGVKVQRNQTIDDSLDVKWQVKFDNQKSIDAMIETLLRVKRNLNNLRRPTND